MRLVLEALYEGDEATSAIDPTTYVNPCGDPDAPDWSGFSCEREILCRENTDTAVVFDITIARDAQQGFFDVAIDFADIFCSAKLDCNERLLHDGDVRSPTAIVGFACTAGEGQQTHLNLSDLTLTCDQGPGDALAPLAPITIPAAFTELGNQGAIEAGVFQYTIYQGDEQITSGG